jgi:hypothetical protein
MTPLMHFLRTRRWLLAVTVLLGLHGGQASAVDALSKELAVMAGDIKKTVDKHGGGAIAVGSFSAAASIKGSSGPEIQIKLSEALKTTGLALADDGYRFEVMGNYLPFEEPTKKLQGVRIVGRVVDAEDGTTLAEYDRIVHGEETVPRMLGLTGQIPHNGSPVDKSDKFKALIKKPEVTLLGTKISTAPGSPYAIEIMVKQGGQYTPRPAVCDEKNRPFVGISHEEVYAVRLYNDSDHEAAVNLSIDGVSCFHFSDLQATYWVVAPHSFYDVMGWHKDAKTSLEFKCVDFPQSAAAKIDLKPNESIGSINAAFCAAWSDNSNKPKDELTRATGFGQEVQTPTQKVNRTIGSVRDVITVRYER